jgi:hypothetical protein
MSEEKPNPVFQFRSLLLGPFSVPGLGGKLFTASLFALLTLLTQVGGLALWPIFGTIYRYSRLFPFLKRILFRTVTLGIAYLVVCQTVVPLTAHMMGRTRLPIFATESLPTGPLHIGYTLLNRTYVQAHTYQAYTEAVRRFGKKHPGITVRYLDAGFPFETIPLLPHLSHSDGQRIDVAFLFESEGKHIDRALSPIGYWGYAKESRPRSECAGSTRKLGPLRVSLRWDFAPLQVLWPSFTLDRKHTRALFRELAKDTRVCSILLEPTLHKILNAPKLSSNPCNVARHDDHFHLSIKKRCRK